MCVCVEVDKDGGRPLCVCVRLAGGVGVDAAGCSWWRGDGGRVGVVLPAVISV